MKKYSLHILFFLLLLAPLCKCQWVQQNVPFTTGIFHDMKFVNQNTGFISNSIPLLIKTTNAGYNWQILNDFNITSISIVDSLYIYGAGHRAGYSKLYKSTDCGLTWDSSLFAGESYGNIYFFNRDTGLICGSDGSWTYIWKTLNGGQTKNLLTTINWSTYGKLFFLKEKVNGEYWGVVYNGQGWFKSTNSGNNWMQMPNFPTFLSAKSVFFINEYTGWATVENISTFIIHTTNGGYNWINQNTPIYGNCFNIFFVNQRIGWIGTEAVSKIIATTNGGINWGCQSLPGGGTFKLFFLDSLTGWAQTSWNSIAHTTNGGGIINQISNNNGQLAKDYLLYQNYPNPFNPVTSIKYKVENTKQIKLIVFDILGKEITTLVNQKQKPGEYEVTFNAALHGTTSPLPSGVYYYVLYADGVRVDAKKMLMIK